MDVLKIGMGAIAWDAIAGPLAPHCSEALFKTIRGYWP
jgi:hypothetical protein